MALGRLDNNYVGALTNRGRAFLQKTHIDGIADTAAEEARLISELNTAIEEFNNYTAPAIADNFDNVDQFQKLADALLALWQFNNQLIEPGFFSGHWRRSYQINDYLLTTTAALVDNQRHKLDTYHRSTFGLSQLSYRVKAVAQKSNLLGETIKWFFSPRLAQWNTLSEFLISLKSITKLTRKPATALQNTTPLVIPSASTTSEVTAAASAAAASMQQQADDSIPKPIPRPKKAADQAPIVNTMAYSETRPSAELPKPQPMPRVRKAADQPVRVDTKAHGESHPSAEPPKPKLKPKALQFPEITPPPVVVNTTPAADEQPHHELEKTTEPPLATAVTTITASSEGAEIVLKEQPEPSTTPLAESPVVTTTSKTDAELIAPVVIQAPLNQEELMQRFVPINQLHAQNLQVVRNKAKPTDVSSGDITALMARIGELIDENRPELNTQVVEFIEGIVEKAGKKQTTEQAKKYFDSLLQEVLQLNFSKLSSNDSDLTVRCETLKQTITALTDTAAQQKKVRQVEEAAVSIRKTYESIRHTVKALLPKITEKSDIETVVRDELFSNLRAQLAIVGEKQPELVAEEHGKLLYELKETGKAKRAPSPTGGFSRIKVYHEDPDISLQSLQSKYKYLQRYALIYPELKDQLIKEEIGEQKAGRAAALEKELGDGSINTLVQEAVICYINVRLIGSEKSASELPSQVDTAKKYIQHIMKLPNLLGTELEAKKAAARMSVSA